MHALPVSASGANLALFTHIFLVGPNMAQTSSGQAHEICACFQNLLVRALQVGGGMSVRVVCRLYAQPRTTHMNPVIYIYMWVPISYCIMHNASLTEDSGYKRKSDAEKNCVCKVYSWFM